METIRKGSIGNDVKRLQTILNRFGLNSGEIDGVFGPNTEKATKELQSIFNLSVDGIVGKETWGLLSKLENVKHFKVDEFRCRHCNEVKLSIDLLLKLEELRERTGPLTINSGYRCPVYNRSKAVGSNDNSQHIRGTASDVRASKMTPNNVYIHANIVFKDGGVGKYNTFTHVDVRGTRSRWNG